MIRKDEYKERCHDVPDQKCCRVPRQECRQALKDNCLDVPETIFDTIEKKTHHQNGNCSFSLFAFLGVVAPLGLAMSLSQWVSIFKIWSLNCLFKRIED